MSLRKSVRLSVVCSCLRNCHIMMAECREGLSRMSSCGRAVVDYETDSAPIEKGVLF